MRKTTCGMLFGRTAELTLRRQEEERRKEEVGGSLCDSHEQAKLEQERKAREATAAAAPAPVKAAPVPAPVKVAAPAPAPVAAAIPPPPKRQPDEVATSVYIPANPVGRSRGRVERAHARAGRRARRARPGRGAGGRQRAERQGPVRLPGDR